MSKSLLIVIIFRIKLAYIHFSFRCADNIAYPHEHSLISVICYKNVLEHKQMLNQLCDTLPMWQSSVWDEEDGRGQWTKTEEEGN